MLYCYTLLRSSQQTNNFPKLFPLLIITLFFFSFSFHTLHCCYYFIPTMLFFLLLVHKIAQTAPSRQAMCIYLYIHITTRKKHQSAINNSGKRSINYNYYDYATKIAVLFSIFTLLDTFSTGSFNFLTLTALPMYSEFFLNIPFDNRVSSIASIQNKLHIERYIHGRRREEKWKYKNK